MSIKKFILLNSKNIYADFLWNKKCINAYSLIIQLKFDKAKLILDEEIKENPNNSLVYFIENYGDYLKSLISEEKKDF